MLLCTHGRCSTIFLSNICYILVNR
uniref:Uncharacterized protein n=1 Tax=Arundo donax TaxID=35708 RepID=A0A0A9B860_ARUDO